LRVVAAVVRHIRVAVVTPCRKIAHAFGISHGNRLLQFLLAAGGNFVSLNPDLSFLLKFLRKPLHLAGVVADVLPDIFIEKHPIGIGAENIDFRNRRGLRPVGQSQRRVAKRQEAQRVPHAFGAALPAELGEKFHHRFIAENSDLLDRALGKRFLKTLEETLAAAAAAAVPDFEALLLFQIDEKVRLVPKQHLRADVRGVVDPFAHEIAEERMVEARHWRGFSIGKNLAGVAIEQSEFAVGLAAEDATDAPGIEIAFEAGVFRKRHHLADGVLVILLIVFRKRVHNEITIVVNDLFEVARKVARVAIAEIADTGFDGFAHYVFSFTGYLSLRA